jgi:hypothetical protein
MATDTVVENGVSFACITKTAFNVRADKVPATVSAKCKP